MNTRSRRSVEPLEGVVHMGLDVAEPDRTSSVEVSDDHQ